MNSKSIRICAGLIFALLSTAVFAQTDFSADVVNHDQGRQNSNPAKIYVTKDKMRLEGLGQGSGHSGAMILNFGKQINTILIPEQKMYMEMSSAQGPGSQRNWAFFRAGDVDNACSDWQKMATTKMHGECRKVGSETVNGRDTVKYEGKSDSGEISHVWLDPKIAFPIKWEGKNSGGELENIKEGAQPSSLFEIPSDYHKMDIGGMGMPNMPKPH